MKILVFLSALLVLVSSCKKDDDKTSAPATVVRYTIQPIDENIIDVRYNNQEQQLIVEDGAGSFSDESVEINVYSKPFTARVGLRFNDYVNSIDEYEVSIFVNGSLKARDTIVNTGPSDIGEGYVEYVVE